jgi:PAS domain-containing protein
MERSRQPAKRVRWTGEVARVLAGAARPLLRRHHKSSASESEERFRLAFENAPIGMTLTGLDGRLFRTNAAFCRVLGYTEAELVGRTFRDITHPDDLPESAVLAKKLFRGGIPNE